MENNTKLLETRLKLALDILKQQDSLIYNLNELGKSCSHLLIWCKEGESTEDNNIFKFSKEDLEVLENLVYTAKTKELVSQRTQDYLKDSAKEIKMKREILDGL